jgi:hypothetical protein
MILPATLLLVGAAIRFWFVLRHAVIQGDSNLYAEIAQNWVQAHTYGFSTDTDYIRPTLIRLPGYPIFLVLCHALFARWAGPDSFTAALILQVLLDLLACLLIACTVRSLLQRSAGEQIGRRGFLLALGLGCLCPFTANYTATPLAEPLVLFTIAAAIYSFERWSSAFRATGKPFNRYLYVLAASLGYSILLRPDQALLAAALLPALLWMSLYPSTDEGTVDPPVILSNALESRLRRRLRGATLGRKAARDGFAPAGVVLLLMLLPLVPWTIRNARTFHVFQPIAPHYATDPGEPIDLGFQRWYRSWAIDFSSTEYFYWKYPDEPIDIAQLPDRAFDTESQYDQTAELIEDSNNAVHFHREIDARFDRLAHERIAASPLRYYVLLPFARLGNMLFHPRTELLPYDLIWWRYRWHPAQTLISWAFVILNFAYIVAAACAWPRLRAVAPPLAWAVLAFFVLRCGLLLTLDNAEQRYTMEFYPLFFLLIPLLLYRTRAKRPVI